MLYIKKYYLFISTVSLVLLNGCTPASTVLSTPAQARHAITQHFESPTPQKMALYKRTMKAVASGIKSDTKYNRITLDTSAKKEWFRMLTYRLWDRQITRQQFLAEGLSKYPNHRYEFEFVINGFNTVCN